MATITPTENGPYKVEGVQLHTPDGEPSEQSKDTMMLCRCGGSSNKPFCDGTHKTNGFEG